MSLKAYLHNIAFAGKALSADSLIYGFISLIYHWRKVLLKVTDNIIPFLVTVLAWIPVCYGYTEIILLGVAISKEKNCTDAAHTPPSPASPDCLWVTIHKKNNIKPKCRI